MLLSVVIKVLNEENKIAACLESIIKATAGLEREIILVDSVSSDKTIEIAEKFPITILQLENADDRCCGVGGQVGFQWARGEFLLMMDGDQLLQRDFLPKALKIMHEHENIAGVGGLVDEQAQSFAFKLRMGQHALQAQEGSVSHLPCGGLYRMSALRDVSYFTNINLHSYEELDVGMRLKSVGWELYRLPIYWVKHFGHEDPPLRLTIKRCKSGYFKGPGELLRSAIGKPYLKKVLHAIMHLLFTVLWWCSLLTLILLSAVFSPLPQAWLLTGAVFVFPFIAMALKKKSIFSGLYSILTWNAQSVMSVIGFFQHQKDPVKAIGVKVLKGNP